MSEIEPHYDDHAITFLEMIWGKGRLSPGGTDEVDRTVKDVDFTGKTVLDIGSGSGGNAIHLAKTTDLAHITGFDVEDPVVETAKKLAREEGVEDRVSFVKGDPGPLPFADESFDVIFSKDSLLHVGDKETLFKEIARILKPGGQIAISDWLTNHDGEMSDQMREYVEAEDLGFCMASPERYENAMRSAGLTDVHNVSRNEWYLERARNELSDMKGCRYQELADVVGADYVDANIQTWTLMIRVLESGEHRPTHLFGKKPA